MSRFSISVYGAKAVANRFRTTAAQVPKDTQEVTYRWGQSVRTALKATPYPPKRPQQRYVRTGRLANSWHAKRQGATGVVIANSARGRRGRLYARYVVGDDKGKRQAWMHRGRWPVARLTIDQMRPQLTRQMQQMIDRRLNGRGGL